MESGLEGIGTRIRFLRETHNIKQVDLAKATDTVGNIGKYEKNEVKPSLEKALAIARFFKVSLDWLITGEEYSQSEVMEIASLLKPEERKLWEHYARFLIWLRKSETKKKYVNYWPASVAESNMNDYHNREEDEIYLPLVGEAAAGSPIWATEWFEGCVPVPKGLAKRKAFLIRAKGDSMVEAGIESGDLVVIHPQPVVENGEKALVLINNEATIKYYYREKSKIILKPANPAYQPIILVTSDTVAVIGKVVGVINKTEAEARMQSLAND